VGGEEGGAATAAALPGGLAAARALERPFAAAIYLGLACWLAGNMAAVYQSMRHYWRIRTDPTYRQARFAAANMTDTGFVGRPFPWSSGNAPPAAQTDSDAPAPPGGAPAPPGGTPPEPASQPAHAPPTLAAQACASSAMAAGRPAMHDGDTSTAPDVPNPDPRPVAPDTRGRLAPPDPRDRPALPPRPAAAASSAMAALSSGSRYASAVAASAAAPFMPARNACQHASASRSGAADLV